MSKVLLVHSAEDPVRLAFAHLFQKRAGMKNQDGSKSPDKYEATFILTPGGKNEANIKQAIKEVASEKFGENWTAIYKAFDDDQKGLRQGDKKIKSDGAHYDGFEGNKYVVAKNETRPGVFDLANNPCASGDEGAPYVGCYVHAEIDVWALAKPNRKKRICSDFLGVRKAADGDAFSSGSSPSKSDAFSDLAVDNADEHASEPSSSGDAFD